MIWVKLFFLCSLFSCGYSLKNTQSPFLSNMGVSKVYLAPVKNLTMSAQLEAVLGNQLIKKFSSDPRVELVFHESLADAIFFSTIQAADMSPAASTGVGALQPSNVAQQMIAGPFAVATTYLAHLECFFELKKKPGGTQIWYLTSVRDDTFAGSNQLDVLGTTSGLINSTEFDRKLLDLTRSMVDDIPESMLALF